jgi:MFS family permease
MSRRIPAAADPGGPGQAARWLAVGLLLAAYAVAFLDRQIISLLVQPLKADLGISDTQIGILQGPAFGLFYAVLGLPLGWLADRVNRVRLISLAIALWSAMTVASGLTNSFEGLLLARVGVGVGEAALVPAAVSLLSDLFRPERRALPLSVFTTGISLGLGLALVLGGAFVTWTSNGAVGALPLLGGWLAAQQPWQATFVLAGLVGLPVAALVLLLDEPRAAGVSAGADGVAAQQLESASGALRYLRERSDFFVPMLLATCALYVLSSAVSAWVPALFIRRFDWSPAHVGQTLGVWIMLFGICGNLLSGALTQTFVRRGRIDAPVRTMLVGTALILPAATIAPLLPDAASVMAGVLAMYFAMALTFGIATTTFVAVTPSRLRGQVVAIYLLLGNLVGLGLGPPLVGALVDHGGATLGRIGPALSLVCVAVGAPALLLMLRARRGFVAAAQSVGR